MVKRLWPVLVAVLASGLIGGDAEAAARASIEVCTKIAEESVPAGPARDTAVSACESAGEAVTP